MTKSWPSLVTLGLSALSAAVLLFWGGQDKQGQFHPEYLWVGGNLGTSLFFVGPYLLMAGAALVAWRHRAQALAILIATAILCGVGVLAVWVDHVAYLQTPPGRETIPVLSFLASILVWLGSLVMLVSALIARARSSAGSAT